jgi:hypothetical protein
MNMKTLQAMSPLMKPEAWPEPDPKGSGTAEGWVLPLDVACVCGGPVKSYMESLLRSQPVTWLFQLDSFLGGAEGVTTLIEAQIRKEAAMRWLAITPEPRRFLVSGNPVACEEILREDLGQTGRVSIEPVALGAVLLPTGWWFTKEIFCGLLASAGELKLRALYNSYLQEFPQADAFPWQGLRFFAGHLRQKKELEVAHLAALDWGRFEALFSPHDETHERATLGPEEISVNPTLQVVRPQGRSTSGDIHLIYRHESALQERQIGWKAAALIDEAAENPRLLRREILENMDHDYGKGSSMRQILEQAESVGHTRDFSVVLTELTEDGVLLLGSEF